MQSILSAHYYLPTFGGNSIYNVNICDTKRIMLNSTNFFQLLSGMPQTHSKAFWLRRKNDSKFRYCKYFITKHKTIWETKFQKNNSVNTFIVKPIPNFFSNPFYPERLLEGKRVSEKRRSSVTSINEQESRYQATCYTSCETEGSFFYSILVLTH